MLDLRYLSDIKATQVIRYKRIRVGINVKTQPPPPAPVSFETKLYFNVERSTVSIEEWLTPMHWSNPWFISMSSASFSSFEVMAISSVSANSTMGPS